MKDLKEFFNNLSKEDIDVYDKLDEMINRVKNMDSEDIKSQIETKVNNLKSDLENLDKEYDALGIMLSNNPLHYKTDILNAKNVTPIVTAKEEYSAKIAGLVRSVKTISTKKGATMAFINLVDETGDIELTLFPETYVNGLPLLEKNSLIIANIKREKRDDNYDFICNKIEPLEE